MDDLDGRLAILVVLACRDAGKNVCRLNFSAEVGWSSTRFAGAFLQICRFRMGIRGAILRWGPSPYRSTVHTLKTVSFLHFARDARGRDMVPTGCEAAQRGRDRAPRNCKSIDKTRLQWFLFSRIA